MPHPSRSNQSDATWQSKVVYALGSVCLSLGLAGSYLVRGSSSRPRASAADPPSHLAIAHGAQQVPLLEEMKQTAAKQVQLLLEKLQRDPNNKELLTQIANTYERAHPFKQAAAYFARVCGRTRRTLAYARRGRPVSITTATWTAHSGNSGSL